MKSRTTRQFREQFAALPASVQDQARQAYHLFLRDPSHPGIRFKRLKISATLYSARVGLGYRAVATCDGDEIVWFWIGSHADYDKFLDQA
jgi:hypothetical protein